MHRFGTLQYDRGWWGRSRAQHQQRRSERNRAKARGPLVLSDRQQGQLIMLGAVRICGLA